MYLVDTDILSAGAPGRRERSRTLIDWMDARSDALFLSDRWLELVLHLYGDRVIPFDIAAANAAGPLMDKARATGRSPGFADLAIAATAASRGLTVLTRNLRHFAPLGIPAADPFETLPD